MVYFDIPGTTLGGSAFKGLAELVADLAAKKDTKDDVDVSNVDIGLTFFEGQNLVDAFGYTSIMSLARAGKITDLSNSTVPYFLPSSKVADMTSPVVLTSAFADDVSLDEDSRNATGQQMIAGLIRGYSDIAYNKSVVVDSGNSDYRDNAGNISTDVSGVAEGTNANKHGWPHGSKLDAINWTDMSSVYHAKNIKFASENSSSVDFSSVLTLFTTNATALPLSATELVQAQGNKFTQAQFVADGKIAEGTLAAAIDADRSGYDLGGRANTAGISSVELDSANQQKHINRDYMMLYNMFEPAPTGAMVWAHSSLKSPVGTGLLGDMSPYLKAGLFKDYFGKNKTALTQIADFAAEISNQVGYRAGYTKESKINEFIVCKDYGFNASEVKKEYAMDLSGIDTEQIGARVREAFEDVFGATGSLADQLTNYGLKTSFGDSDGVLLIDVSSANDVKGYAELVQKFTDFIENDPDHAYSTAGIVDPTGSGKNRKTDWEEAQARFVYDPRIASADISAAKDKQLRVFLETLKGVLATPSSSGTYSGATGSDASFNDVTAEPAVLPGSAGMNTNTGPAGSYALNEIYAGISGGLTYPPHLAHLSELTGVTGGISSIVDGKPIFANMLPTVAIGGAKGSTTANTDILGDNAKNPLRFSGADVSGAIVSGVYVPTYQRWAEGKGNWTDPEFIWGDHSSTDGLFFLDSMYNIRSRIPGLDLIDTNASTSNLKSMKDTTLENSRSLLALIASDQTASMVPNTNGLNTVSGGADGDRTIVPNAFRPADFFSPATLFKNFVNPNNFEQAAHVVLRYFDVADLAIDELSNEDKTMKFGYVKNNTVYYPTIPVSIRGSSYSDLSGNSTTYEDNYNTMMWLWDYAMGVHADEKEAIKAIVDMQRPMSIYVDEKDHSAYEKPADQVAAARAVQNFLFTTTDAVRVNEQRPEIMVHALIHFLLSNKFRASGTKTSTQTVGAVLNLMELYNKEALQALKTLATGDQTTNSLEGGHLSIFTGAVDLDANVSDVFDALLTAVVHFGKSKEQFMAIAQASGKTVEDAIIDAFDNDIDKLEENTTNFGIFNDGSTSYHPVVKHLSFWLEYLSLLTPAQLAARAVNEDGLLSSSLKSQVKMLGLIQAACKGKAASFTINDDAVRKEGINAFYNAGVQVQFMTLEYSSGGADKKINLGGTLYAAGGVTFDTF